MSIDQILVTASGLVLIAGIWSFFFMKREKIVSAVDSITITVDGGYSPDVVAVNAGQEIALVFERKDPSPCLEELVMNDFGIRRFLPLNQKVEIRIRPRDKRSYSFSCGMNMYHGRIIAG